MDFQLRDSRSPGWYWVENDAFDLLTKVVKDCRESGDPQRKRIGPLVHAVYHSLTRFLNTKAKVSRPKIQTICDAVGAGRSKVFVALGILEEFHLIRKKSGKELGKGNLYAIIDAEKASKMLANKGPRRKRPEAPEPVPDAGADPPDAERGVHSVDTPAHPVDGGVHPADTLAGAVAQSAASSESSQPQEEVRLSCRPSSPRNLRKSRRKMSVQDGCDINEGYKGGPSGAPLPLRKCLSGFLQGKDPDPEGRALAKRITRWLLEHKHYPSKQPENVLWGQIRAIIRKLGRATVERTFNFVARGADPTPFAFWNLINAKATS